LIRSFAFLDPPFRHVPRDAALGRAARVCHYDAKAGIKLYRMPFDLGDRSRGFIQLPA
jgi:hypothetical protein